MTIRNSTRFAPRTVACLSFWLMSVGLFSGVFGGCGLSPLLNHTQAEKKIFRTPQANIPGQDSASDPSAISAPTGSECMLSFPASELCARIEWKHAPDEEDPDKGEFGLWFWNAKMGSAQGPWTAPPGEIKVQLWMPSMGHGSSPPQVSNPAPGYYKVQRVFFVMRGPWEIRVRIMNAGSGGTVREEARIPFEF